MRNDTNITAFRVIRRRIKWKHILTNKTFIIILTLRCGSLVKVEVMEKVVYHDGDNIRALKGTIEKEDDFFVHVRADGVLNLIRIGKKYIIKIEEINNEK